MTSEPEKWKIVLVGAGNLAWHLGHALTGKGMIITQVISRSATSAQKLAEQFCASHTNRLTHLEKDADICIICVTDDAIPSVARAMEPDKCLLLHTSGSVPMSVFGMQARHHGVFYPVQTFTRGKPLDFSKVPVLIEANTSKDLDKLLRFASAVSERVICTDSLQRLQLHLAAVFASNFPNHMYTLAERLMNEGGLPFDLLFPLIGETAAKAMQVSPAMAQTGPAIRNNRLVMEKHMELLADRPEWKELYRIISESISKSGGS